MIRGTTPTHRFRVRFDTNTIDKVEITYKQNNKLILTRDTCDISGNVLSITLTQEETFMFDCRYIAKAQIRILTKNNKVIASRPISINVYECQSNEVL